MLDNIFADLRHYSRYCYHGRPIWKILPFLIISHPAFIGICWYRFGKAAWRCRIPCIKQLLQLLYILVHPLARIFSGVQIHLSADIAPGLAILHSGGIVIATGTSIGPDSLLHQNVNLVMYRDSRGPEIGARFYAGAGVIVIDHVKIEDDVSAGAGCIITKSVPRNAVVAGAPARFIRFRNPDEHPSENITLAKRLVKDWISIHESTSTTDRRYSQKSSSTFLQQQNGNKD